MISDGWVSIGNRESTSRSYDRGGFRKPGMLLRHPISPPSSFFRAEDARYLTGHRSHLGPVAALSFGNVVLHRNGEYVLYTMDQDTCREGMPWLAEEQIQPRANVRDPAGTSAWAEAVKARFGIGPGDKVGVDLWTPSIEASLKAAFPDRRVR